jgi:hypothetical protein
VLKRVLCGNKEFYSEMAILIFSFVLNFKSGNEFAVVLTEHNEILRLRVCSFIESKKEVNRYSGNPFIWLSLLKTSILKIRILGRNL